MTELCKTSDLSEGQSLGFRSHRGPVFAIRYDDIVYVYQNECPHLGVNLEFQENEFLDQDGRLIQCSMHGALFEIESGQCLSGPCQGDTLKPIPFEIINDTIVVR